MFTTPGIAHLGEARLLAGHPEEAHALAGRALTVARERGQRGQEAWALRLFGEIGCAREASDTDAATGYYRQAIALADELGMQPLVAHCHLGLGRLYRRTARPDTARDHFALAMTKFRDLEMRLWLERAEAEAA
jgi:sugar phosphate isomerase/epimerase